MLRSFTLLMSLFPISTLCFPQHVIQGRLSSKVDKRPVPYANIGIVNSSVGTLSNEDGTFRVTIPLKNEHDSLLFAALGYERQLISVQYLLEHSAVSIELVEKAKILEQVIVAEKKRKNKILSPG